MAGIALYKTAAEIEEVVRRFESCEYMPEEFVHAKHLTVAAYYFFQWEKEVAETRMRSGLRKFIRHHRKNAYHETITRFWLQMAGFHCRAEVRREGLVTAVNNVVEQLGNKDLIYDYFSRACLDSPEAKAAWMEPNLKRLP
jgi:hypothetical protein